MWKNRIILIILIITSGILVSNYGGNFSYALFYFSMGIPLIALLYSVYVYARFKLYQFTEHKTIVKGETTEYSFQLANEEGITFESLKVNFFHDKSKVFHLDEGKEYCLLPKQKLEMETRITCDYRGEYFVGVESVVITDFLYLFRITYPVRDKLPITVLPRIVELDQCPVLSPDLDHKRSAFQKNGDTEPDIEVREYASGDSIKKIHWKASAKRNQWMVRKYMQIPEPSVSLFVDFTPVGVDKEIEYIMEDKILETAIAISNYYCKKNINCNLYYDQFGINQYEVRNEADFDQFYQSCVKIHFNASLSPADLMDQWKRLSQQESDFIVVTHTLTKTLYQNTVDIIGTGQNGVIIFICQRISDEEQNIQNFLEEAGIRVLKIAVDQEVKDRLETGR